MKVTLAITIWWVCNIESNKKYVLTSRGNKPQSNKKLSSTKEKKKSPPNLIAFRMELQDGCFKGVEQMWCIWILLECLEERVAHNFPHKTAAGRDDKWWGTTGHCPSPWEAGPTEVMLEVPLFGGTEHSFPNGLWRRSQSGGREAGRYIRQGGANLKTARTWRKMRPNCLARRIGYTWKENHISIRPRQRKWNE